MMPYIYEQEGTRANDGSAQWFTRHFDDYDTYMQAGSAGELGRRRGLDQVGFWQKISEHPAYDAFWREQAVDKLLAAQPLKVPVMLVHSLWDQEDIYGAPAVYKAIKPKDTGNDMVYLVLGPWYHGQAIRDGSTLGALNFHSDTALHFRQQVLRPFLDQYLKDGAPKADIAPVTAFETGTNTASAAGGCLGAADVHQADAALSRCGFTDARRAGSRRCVRGIRSIRRRVPPARGRINLPRGTGRAGSLTTSERHRGGRTFWRSPPAP
jgi:hypothetical protein